MVDLAFIALLTLAIAIGFLLGRRSVADRSKLASLSPGKSYFQGLNFLLNEQPDKAVEEFVRLLDVNTHTLETHLALGKLMRKQGQVDRAIRIHQNLLARPQLEVADQHQVHLELARDFMVAGLLDRAETLLQEVIDESNALRSIAQRYLIDIYQDESEWQAAIDVAQAVLQSKFMKTNLEARKEISKMIAHFHCQLAEERSESGDYEGAKKYLDLASAADKNVLRVSLLLATTDNKMGRHKQVIKSISKIESQHPNWFSYCLPVLTDSYVQLQGEQGFNHLVHHLTQHVEKQKANTVVVYLIDQLLARVNEQPERFQQAREILSRYTESCDSLTAANKLVELRVENFGDEAPSDVVRLHKQVKALLAKRNIYRCEDCGFSGRQLHWRCPSCKSWDSMNVIDDQMDKQ